MNKAEIEHSVSNNIRKATEKAIIAAMNDLNNAGHNYQPVDEFLFEWAEPDSDDLLQITWAIGVGISARQECRPVDHIVESFISLAESGDDGEATILSEFEGDIANGGFMQLYDNKGEEFIKDCIVLLQKIKSKSALRIVEHFQLLLQEEEDALRRYENFQKKVDNLNNRFWKIKESIPALFMRYRQQQSG